MDRTGGQEPTTMGTVEVRDLIYQLVESEYDHDVARTNLRDFHDATTPPAAPSEFNSLEEFLNFHDYKLRFVEQERALTAARDDAQGRYDHASAWLQRLLPENTPLRFAYAGEYPELLGRQYTIENRNMGTQGHIAVSYSQSADA